MSGPHLHRGQCEQRKPRGCNGGFQSRRKNCRREEELGVSPAQLICRCFKEVWEEPPCPPGSLGACSVTFLLQAAAGHQWEPRKKIAAAWVPITFSGGFNAFSKAAEIGSRWRQCVRSCSAAADIITASQDLIGMAAHALNIKLMI